MPPPPPPPRAPNPVVRALRLRSVRAVLGAVTFAAWLEIAFPDTVGRLRARTRPARPPHPYAPDELRHMRPAAPPAAPEGGR